MAVRGRVAGVAQQQQPSSERSTSIMLCHVTLCYATLCYVMLCCVMLCYVMLCYVMLRRRRSLLFFLLKDRASD